MRIKLKLTSDCDNIYTTEYLELRTAQHAYSQDSSILMCLSDECREFSVDIEELLQAVTTLKALSK